MVQIPLDDPMREGCMARTALADSDARHGHCQQVHLSSLSLLEVKQHVDCHWVQSHQVQQAESQPVGHLHWTQGHHGCLYCQAI